MKRLVSLILMSILIVISTGCKSRGNINVQNSSSDDSSAKSQSVASSSEENAVSSNIKSDGESQLTASGGSTSSKGQNSKAQNSKGNSAANTGKTEVKTPSSSKSDSRSTSKSTTSSSSSEQSAKENSTAEKTCPICGGKLNADGSCNVMHDYTGYGHCIYDGSTVYIVCDTCGQRWPESSYAEPINWVNDHALNCYNEHNKTYIYCDYCGKKCEEGTMYRDSYCSRECLINSGYYCPNCESRLYIDGCHNCGYGMKCDRCGQTKTADCDKRYCTVCGAHTGHTADAHCPVCNSTEHTVHPTDNR